MKPVEERKYSKQSPKPAPTISGFPWDYQGQRAPGLVAIGFGSDRQARQIDLMLPGRWYSQHLKVDSSADIVGMGIRNNKA